MNVLDLTATRIRKEEEQGAEKEIKKNETNETNETNEAKGSETKKQNAIPHNRFE